MSYNRLSMMILTAIILGIVEGLTEFLPVSSTGHLIITGNLLDFTGSTADTFEVFIQLGAILAVVWLYRERFFRLLDFKKKRGLQGKRGIGLLLLTTLPALIFGFLLHDFIKDHLFQPLTVAIGLAVGGIALIIFERFEHKVAVIKLDDITPQQALLVGMFQLLALWPGVSRSASTIIGGMIQGLDRKTAVEYSFLIAVPVMIAATGYDLLKSLSHLQSSDFALFAVGFITAFASAIFAIQYFVQFVQRFGFTAFGWYRIALAILVVIVLV
jgi:undecaprenyl-diphosphatase